LRFEAAILSRTRSPMTSRSNWAKESRTLRVSLPMLEVVLKDWVTDTKETPCSSKSSTSLAKSASDLVSRRPDDPPVAQEFLSSLEVSGTCMHKRRVTTHVCNAKVPTQNPLFFSSIRHSAMALSRRFGLAASLAVR
jgi:hypothetical protein